MATGIRIDNDSVIIPLELLDSPKQGLAVLTLARGAFLVMSTEMLDALPRQRLLDLSRTAQTLERSRTDAGSTFIEQKRRALDMLQEQGYTVSGGLEYGLQAIAAPDITLEQVREGLSTIKGSLAQEVRSERDER